ncbi:MAG: GTPase ObgE [Dissulfurimicrobium sp.]|uniref:GTPase ObgE n=1 Tax=Dissulfurimicrobium TaxID=1769732 RepID=UPI003C7616DB
MNFIDQAEIHIKAGDGGRGCVSFRRERYVPKGGPDGGDGGKGGNVVFRVKNGLNTLQRFRHRRVFKAEDGKAGRGKNQHGKAGHDLIIEVPPGTVIKDLETGAVLADLTNPGEEWIAARGGKGGLGNSRFVSAMRQTPRYAQPGLKGEERDLALELKLLADIGLVGVPNAGKSTLLSRISAARPKIAGYPFTTLVPNLGVINLSDGRTMVAADIPGLIEGAHLGAGMGIDFLRHIERTKVILFVIDASGENPFEEFEMVRSEMERYRKALTEKPFLIALNKTDMLDRDMIERLKKTFSPKTKAPCFISALTGTGIPELLEILYNMSRPTTMGDGSNVAQTPILASTAG